MGLFGRVLFAVSSGVVPLFNSFVRAVVHFGRVFIRDGEPKKAKLACQSGQKSAKNWPEMCANLPIFWRIPKRVIHRLKRLPMVPSVTLLGVLFLVLFWPKNGQVGTDFEPDFGRFLARLTCQFGLFLARRRE